MSQAITSYVQREPLRLDISLLLLCIADGTTCSFCAESAVKAHVAPALLLVHYLDLA